MTDASKTLVVIPAFNEEVSIAKVIQEVAKALPGCGCLVVDDGSTDRTASIARESGVLVASLPFNMGVGAAMRVGFNVALAMCFDNVVQIDADGQHNPVDAPALLHDLEQYDVVIGTRFAGTGDYSVRGPRKWAMKVLASALSRISSEKLSDTTSGFRASGPRAVQLFASHYPAEYLGDTVESLVIAAKAGLKIHEHPVQMRVREGGEPSHGPIKATIFLARVALALLFAMLRPSLTEKGNSR